VHSNKCTILLSIAVSIFPHELIKHGSHSIHHTGTESKCLATKLDMGDQEKYTIRALAPKLLICHSPIQLVSADGNMLVCYTLSQPVHVLYLPKSQCSPPASPNQRLRVFRAMIGFLSQYWWSQQHVCVLVRLWHSSSLQPPDNIKYTLYH